MRKRLLILAVVLVVAAAILTGLAHYYTEYLWFDHLGFGAVFSKRLLTQVGMGVVFGIIALAVLLVHVLLIRRFSKPRAVWTISTASGDVIDVKDVVKKVTTPVVISAAMVVAVVMGVWASRHWEELLKIVNQTPFGKTEPILGQDIGFYLFTLPIYQFVQEWLVYLTGIGLVFSAAVYMLRNAIAMKNRLVEASNQVRAHLLFSLASVLVIMAWGWRLEMFEILFSKRGIAYGATYTDVYANLVAYRIMIVVCVVAAAYLIYLALRPPEGAKATKYPAYALASVVGLYLIGSFVAPELVQRFVVNPNELDKERPYLANAIKGTREAYGLDKIEVKAFPATDKLTAQDLQDNKATIDNIKIWDHRPLRATYKQMQAIRLYYDFPSITDDRYRAHGSYWQVMLSPRELIASQLPEQSQTWVNKHLQYTHGYGVCLSPVKRVTQEGLPDLWIKDIPPRSPEHPSLKIDRPEIYYGQQTNDYSLVKTGTKEFDYPKGSENVYTTYEGKGGVGIGSFFRRLLFTIRFGDLNLFFTKYLTPESRVLFYRNVQERVHSVAPFLMTDQEAYIVVEEGRLFWVQDAYTVAYRYPYSQPTKLGKRRRINYIRNSVKAVVDAYHGTVTLYLWDQSDPLIQTYAKMFPTLLRPASEMPASLRPHMRYPKDLFAIQADTYESFHMTDPQIFYNQEDKWALPRELESKSKSRREDLADQGPAPAVGVTAQAITSTPTMDPYYMIMRLPGETEEEYLLMLPYTPVNKDNMVAWMSARCDPKDYGKLLVYTFPKEKQIFGPMQIDARIDQDRYISQWITLRNREGSKVIRGDLLVIPIKDAILYVEPIYLQSTQTQLPELKEIVVAFGNQLQMKETLHEALQAVFQIDENVAKEVAGEKGGPATQPAGPGTAAPSAAVPGAPAVSAAELRRLLGEAVEHYRAGQDKVGKGDWAGYGEEQRALKKALDDLAAGLEGQLKPRAAAPAPAPAQR